MKAPSTNIQAPEKDQCPITKRHATLWCLLLGASLDVGAWNLDFYG
jgi:hypothetical protein